MVSLPVVYERVGECNRCGDCCKTGDPFDGARGPARFEGACPLYDEVDGIGTCTDRDHVYGRNACDVFPSNPQNVIDHPRCSYRFEVRGGG
jgi:hypothetical protein